MSIDRDKNEIPITSADRRLVENVLYMFLFLLFGILLSIQIRDGINMQEQLSSSKTKYSAYQQQLEDLKGQNIRLKEQNVLLIAQKDQLTETVLNEQGYSQLAIDLADTRKLAGLTRIDGPGVIVTLSDSTITDVNDMTQSSLIHAQDIQYIIDILKIAGAKAISVNGDRIISTTSISCAGPTVRVNNSRYPVPFVISSVCEPNSTYDILKNDPNILFRLSEGVEIAIEKSESISVLPFSDNRVIDKLSMELGVENQP